MADLYTEVRGLILLLEEEVKHWQRELQLKYAELFADVDLHRFSPWYIFCFEINSVNEKHINNTLIVALQNTLTSKGKLGYQGFSYYF